MKPSSTLIACAVTLGVLTVSSLALWRLRESSLSWDEVNASIDREFPAVASITTAELAAEMADPERPAPRLLDVRTHEEFVISHLPGAVHAPSAQEALRVLAAEPADRDVVVYCSVGWRSAAMADHLRSLRPGRVRNLRGSIFQWANEDRPLQSASGPTEEVHSYNARWGTLLDRSR